MVRPGFPEPVGSRFGIVAKALLALAKCHLGPLAVLDVGSRPVPFDDVSQLVAQRFGLEPEPAIFALEAPEPGFKPAGHAGRPYCGPLLQHAFPVVRMKSARPAGFGLVRRDAGIVEGGLIEKAWTPTPPRPPD